MISTKAIFWGLVSTSMVLGITNPAQATTFNFDDTDYNQTTINKTVDGIAMTLSNPSPKPFYSDFSGLCVISGTPSCEITGFNISFSSDVKLISYDIGFANALGSDRTLTLSDGTSTSLEIGNWDIGTTRKFANQFIVKANQVVNVTTAGIQPGDILQWSSLEVVQTVPEPTTILGVLTLGYLGALAKRKRSQ
jgi:hypothetical protein